MAPETRLVRIKPYNPKAGCVIKSYTFQGIRFQVERGWYRVPLSVANALRTKRQQSGREHAPLAFDVCTEAEARAMEQAEKEAAAQKRDTASRIPMEIPRGFEEEDGAEDDEDAASAGAAPEKPAATSTSAKGRATGKGRIKK